MKKIVVLTGAGMSAESGFETFRDAGGLWEKYPVEQVATPEGWEADPDLVTDFYNARRKQLLTAVPNRGHELLAALEKDFDVTVVTQNVDNLHERAGSSHVIHLHGELMKVTSSHDPDNPRYIRTLRDDEVIVPHGAKAADGSLLRPCGSAKPCPTYRSRPRRLQKPTFSWLSAHRSTFIPPRGLFTTCRPKHPFTSSTRRR